MAAKEKPPKSRGPAESVEQWLLTQGYQLEYLAYQAFRDQQLAADLGEYVESAESKLREIDVCVTAEGKRCVVRLLVECKYSADKPWVLLTSELETQLEADWAAIPKSPGLARFRFSFDPIRRLLEPCWHFEPSQVLAHSLVQAHAGNNKDQAFDAVQKIAHAAWDWAEGPARRENRNRLHLAAIPCVVVEAPLFVARFDPSQDCFKVDAVPFGRLHWSGCRNGTLIDVVQASALSEYAIKVKATLGALSQLLSLDDFTRELDGHA